MNRTKSLSKSTLISCISWFLFSIHAHGMEEEKLIRKLKSLSDYKLMHSDMQLYDLGKDYPESMFSSFTEEVKELTRFPFPEKVKELTRKEVYARLSQGGNKEILEILASSLYTRLGRTLHNEAIVHNFFQVFQHATRWNPPEAYRNILKGFLDDNDYTLKKLPLSKEQFEYINSYGNKTPPTGTALLEKAQKTGNADEFFAIFKTLTDHSPSDAYRDALSNFFEEKAGEIKKLPFSAKQVEDITKYVNKPQTWLVLLEGALKRAKGDADQFFAIFDAITWGFPDDDDRRALNKFFQDNAEDIKKLPFSVEQIRYMDTYILKVETSTIFLKEGLERAGGDADKFFSIFKALTNHSPSDAYENALEKFFADNVEEIKKLPFSIEQIGYMEKYISRVSTSIMLLEEGLERAGGDAGKFFSIFKALTDHFPSDAYRDALDKFFEEKAGEIKKLPFSMEQIGYMKKYIRRVSTSMMLLEAGLERAGGDAGKFFSIFKTLTDYSPSDAYRNALDKFFVDKAEEIKKLPFSTKQIRYMEKYINKISVGIMLLERGLERAGGDADKFFSIFKALTDHSLFGAYRKALDKFFSIFNPFTDHSPSGAYREALNKFFNDNIEAIKKLPFSFRQVQHMANYAKNDKILVMFLEGGLERAGGDADKFFNAFREVAIFFPSREYREALEEFFLEKAETILDLGLSTNQIRYMDHYIKRPSVSAEVFEAALRKSGGNCAASVIALFSLEGLNSEANAESDALLYQ